MRNILLAFCLFLAVPADAAHCDTPPKPYRIDGHSLAPLIQPGQVVKTVTVPCAGTIARGGFIVFRSGAHKSPIIKQVRGVPGDRFAVRDGRIILNGGVLTIPNGQPYALSAGRSKMIALYERDFGGVIPLDAYLVLGTIPSGGLDSTRLGLISRRDVIGVARLPAEESTPRGEAASQHPPAQLARSDPPRH